MTKTIQELNTITTPNLLKYYKAERKRYYAQSALICSCCGQFLWDIYPHIYKDSKQKWEKHIQYLELIKSVLNTREHVNPKKPSNERRSINMKIKTKIKISKEELTNLIKEHYQIDGNVDFIVEEDIYKCGYNDEGNVYSTRHIFTGVKITNSKQK